MSELIRILHTPVGPVWAVLLVFALGVLFGFALRPRKPVAFVNPLIPSFPDIPDGDPPRFWHLVWVSTPLHWPLDGHTVFKEQPDGPTDPAGEVPTAKEHTDGVRHSTQFWGNRTRTGAVWELGSDDSPTNHDPLPPVESAITDPGSIDPSTKRRPDILKDDTPPTGRGQCGPGSDYPLPEGIEIGRRPSVPPANREKGKPQ